MAVFLCLPLISEWWRAQAQYPDLSSSFLSLPLWPKSSCPSPGQQSLFPPWASRLVSTQQPKGDFKNPNQGDFPGSPTQGAWVQSLARELDRATKSLYTSTKEPACRGQSQRSHVPRLRPGTSFRMDWLDLLTVQGTLKSLLQHHSSKATILRCNGDISVWEAA